MITRWQHFLFNHCVSVFHPWVALSSVARDVPEYSTVGRRQTDLQEHEIHETPGTRRVGETRYARLQLTQVSESLKLSLVSLGVDELKSVTNSKPQALRHNFMNIDELAGTPT